MEKYRVLEKIGAGAHGEVFMVEERTSFASESESGSGECDRSRQRKSRRNKESKKRTWVMKVIPLPQGKENKASCLKEAATMLKLSHPGIVACKESFIDPEEGVFCIAMERCTGGELRHYIAKQRELGKLLAEDQILDWLLQLLLAVEYLHHKNVLHRDLKSENVFLRDPMDFPHGNLASVQLGDFGISRVLKHADETANSFVGTPLYMSPELIRNEPYNHKSDIWALGCIMYEMMCLRKPFEAETVPDLVYLVLKTDYPEPPPCYSPELCFLLSKMLEKDASKRPSAATLLSFPLLKERAAKFLASCREFAEDAQAESEELRSPSFVRRYEIHKEVLHQARRLGMRLSLSNASAACAASCAILGSPLSGKENSPREVDGAGEDYRDGPKRHRARSPLRENSSSEGMDGLEAEGVALERLDESDVDLAPIPTPGKRSPLHHQTKSPTLRGSRSRSSESYSEGRAGREGRVGSKGGSGELGEGRGRRGGSGEMSGKTEKQRAGSGDSGSHERRRSAGSGDLGHIDSEQRRPKTTSNTGTRRTGSGGLRPVFPLPNGRRQNSWSPTDVDIPPLASSGLSPASPPLPLAGLSLSPLPPHPVLLHHPPKPSTSGSTIQLAEGAEGNREVEGWEGFKGRRMSGDFGRMERETPKRQPLVRRKSHDAGCSKEGAAVNDPVVMSPPTPNGPAFSPPTPVRSVEKASYKTQGTGKLHRGMSTGLNGTKVKQKLPPRASTSGRAQMSSDPLIQVNLDEIRELQGEASGLATGIKYSRAMFKSKSGDGDIVRNGERVGVEETSRDTSQASAQGPQTRSRSPLNRGNSVGTGMMKETRTGRSRQSLRRGNSVGQGLHAEHGTQQEAGLSPPWHTGHSSASRCEGAEGRVPGDLGCVQEDVDTVNLDGEGGEGQSSLVRLPPRSPEVPRSVSAPGRRRRGSSRPESALAETPATNSDLVVRRARPSKGESGVSYTSSGQDHNTTNEGAVAQGDSLGMDEASTRAAEVQERDHEPRPRSALERGNSVEPSRGYDRPSKSSQGRLTRGYSTGAEALLEPGVGSVIEAEGDRRHSPYRRSARASGRTPNRTPNRSPNQPSNWTPNRSPNQDQVKRPLVRTPDPSPPHSPDNCKGVPGERSAGGASRGKSFDEEKEVLGREGRRRTRSSSTEIEEVKHCEADHQSPSHAAAATATGDGVRGQRRNSKEKSREPGDAKLREAGDCAVALATEGVPRPAAPFVNPELSSSEASSANFARMEVMPRSSSSHGARSSEPQASLGQRSCVRENGSSFFPLSVSYSGMSPRPSAKGSKSPDPQGTGGPHLSRSRSRSPVNFKLPFIGSPWSSKAASPTRQHQALSNTHTSEEGEKGGMNALRAIFARLQVSPEESTQEEHRAATASSGGVSPGGTFGPSSSPLLQSPTSIVARSFARLSPRLRPKLGCFLAPSVCEEILDDSSLSPVHQGSHSGYSGYERSESGNSGNLSTSLTQQIPARGKVLVQVPSGEKPCTDSAEKKEKERDSEDSDSSWLREVIAGMQQLPRATSAPTQDTQGRENGVNGGNNVNGVSLRSPTDDICFDEQSWKRLAEAAATVRKGAFQKEARLRPVITVEDSSPSITSPCTPRDDPDVASPHMRHLLAKAPLSRVFGPPRRRHARRPPKNTRKRMSES